MDSWGTPLDSNILGGSQFVATTRKMNLHDFQDPEIGGLRLVDNLSSARNELSIFLNERRLELCEPMEVNITIEVVARVEPAQNTITQTESTPLPMEY